MRKILFAVSFFLFLFLFLPQTVSASCNPRSGVNCGRGVVTCNLNGSFYCCDQAGGGCSQLPGSLPAGVPPQCNASGGSCLPTAYTCSTNYGPQDCPSGERCGSGCVAPTQPTTGSTPPKADLTKCDNGTAGIQTAIGCIRVFDQTTFLSDILKWAVGIGGGIAFLLIVYAGFMIMTAAGSPDRLKAGQELLTSALSGLILLVLSIFVLRFIGVDILQLCRFGFGPAC